MSKKNHEIQTNSLTQSNNFDLSESKKRVSLNKVSGSEHSETLFFDNRINLISVEELAVIFRLAPQTIRNWIALRKIPYVKIGRRHFFQEESLKRWLTKKEKPQWQ